MGTHLEYMIADFANALNEYGKTVIIDGVPVQALTAPERIERGGFERENVIGRKIWHAPLALAPKVPDQLIDVDGVRWQVVSHADQVAGVSMCLELQRSAG